MSRAFIRTCSIGFVIIHVQNCNALFQGGYQRMVVDGEHVGRGEVKVRDVLPLIAPETPVNRFKPLINDRRLYDAIANADECVVRVVCV